MARSLTPVRLWVAAAGALLHRAASDDAFVLLGPTGDNALRDAGVWAGVYEAFAGGAFEAAGGVGVFAAMNAPHTVEELHTKMAATLDPLYTKLQHNAGWKCQAKGGDCTPKAFIDSVQVNIWVGRDACEQAANMTAALEKYGRVSLYLSVPPFVFGTWSTCAVKNWGKGDVDRIHVVAEKPFGTSLENAVELEKNITENANLPHANLHLVDHWLSFFMVKNLPSFQPIVREKLGIQWDNTAFEKVVVTQFEERGLQGRGGFFDTVGQVRDMVQSHLLQVMAMSVVDQSAQPRAAAKLGIFKATEVTPVDVWPVGGCHHGQYDGYLLEPKLSYHPSFADATWSAARLDVNEPAWMGVNFTIVTGKATGQLLYTVDFFQKGGPGVVRFDIGKEEVGIADIRVFNWPLKDNSAFKAPIGGFDTTRTATFTPDVAADGNGYILRYSDPSAYFPNPYAILVSNLLKREYDASFVTFPECQRSWEIVTAGDTSLCLDPAPEKVTVYKTGMLWEPHTVKDEYDVTFACTKDNDIKYVNISFYQAKCHHPVAAEVIMFV